MNTISVRQTAIICSIMLFASKILVLPSLMYEANFTFSICSLIILFALDLLVLFIAIKIKEKNKNISLFNYFSQKIGKIITKIIFFILFLFFLLKYIYIIQEGFSFLKEALYSDATILTYLLCVIPVACAIVYKGLKNFGRTIEIFYYLMIAGVAFCTLAWIASIFGTGINFFETNGIEGFLTATFKYTFWFGDFIFIFIFLDKIKIEENYGKTIMRYVLISVLILVLFFVSYFYIYQNTAFYHTNAILDIIQFSAKIGTVGKIDIIAIGIYMFLLFFQATLFLFCCCNTLEKIIPFKNISQNLIINNIITITTIYFLNNNINKLIIIYSDYLFYFAIIICYFLPIIFLILVKKRNKGELK